MIFSARFALETGRLVGIVSTHDVPALSHDGFVYVELPDFFDPSRFYIQGDHRNFVVREIPSVTKADFLEAYPPARQLKIMRRALASLVDIDTNPEFAAFHDAMEQFDE